MRTDFAVWPKADVEGAAQLSAQAEDPVRLFIEWKQWIRNAVPDAVT